jgi:IS1 family transposase
VRIGGKRTYLWRAVEHEGEVLEMLVQRRRDTQAALRLMRKLLKKQGFVPKFLVTDKLRSYASAFRRLRLTCRQEQGLRKNNGWRIRIRQFDDASASCSGSSRLDPPSASSACSISAIPTAIPINLLIELIGRHNMVDQPDPFGLRRGHQIAGKQVLLGTHEADELRPDQRAAVHPYRSLADRATSIIRVSSVPTERRNGLLNAPSSSAPRSSNPSPSRFTC